MISLSLAISAIESIGVAVLPPAWAMGNWKDAGSHNPESRRYPSTASNGDGVDTKVLFAAGMRFCTGVIGMRNRVRLENQGSVFKGGLL